MSEIHFIWRQFNMFITISLTIKSLSLMCRNKLNSDRQLLNTANYQYNATNTTQQTWKHNLSLQRIQPFVPFGILRIKAAEDGCNSGWVVVVVVVPAAFRVHTQDFYSIPSKQQEAAVLLVASTCCLFVSLCHGNQDMHHSALSKQTWTSGGVE